MAYLKKYRHLLVPSVFFLLWKTADTPAEDLAAVAAFFAMACWMREVA